MGSVIDMLVMAMGAGGTATVLARSLHVWLTQPRSDVKIEISNLDGRRGMVYLGRIPDAVQLVRDVLADADARR
jgi:hypothetical protein